MAVGPLPARSVPPYPVVTDRWPDEGVLRMRKPMNRALEGLAPSGIRRINALAAAHPGCIALALGEPDFDTPEPICTAAHAALDAHQTHYPPNNGTASLRAALASYMAGAAGGDARLVYAPDGIVVTCGATEALHAALAALLEPGDEVVIPTPAFGLYDSIVRMHGAVPRLLDTAPHAFQIDEAALAAAVGPATKALVLCSPNNPTGCILSAASLDAVARVAARHGIYVICDDVYNRLVYGVVHGGAAGAAPAGTGAAGTGAGVEGAGPAEASGDGERARFAEGTGAGAADAGGDEAPGSKACSRVVEISGSGVCSRVAGRAQAPAFERAAEQAQAPAFERFAARHCELRDQIVVVDSFSKPWAMTGWRVGWVAAAAPVAAQIAKAHQFMVSSVPAFIMPAAEAALACDPEPMRTVFQARRARVLQALKDMELPVVEPGGAFYAFPSIAGTGLGSEEFCERAIAEAGVALVPGTCFSAEGFVRLSFCVADADLDEGLRRLGVFVRGLKRREG